MSRRLVAVLALTALVTTSGCAFGPIYSHETARSVGKDGNEFTFGLGQAGYGLKYSRGVSESFDLGLQFELMSVGLRAKYAFVNNPSRGWSLAGAAGLGYSDGGTHYYGDLLLSHLAGWFEPYGLVRVVRVKTDPFDVNSDRPDAFKYHVDSMRYQYGQVILGARFWTAPRWELTVELSSFVSTHEVHLDDGYVVSVGFGHRW